MKCYEEIEKITNNMPSTFIIDPMTIWVGNEGTEKANGMILIDHCGLDYLRRTLTPSSYKVYALRENDDLDGNPATVENNEVTVNFFGYFITKADLDWQFNEQDYIEVYSWDYDPW